jgi:hypothetical protein
MDFFDDLERLAQVYVPKGGGSGKHNKSISANKSDFKKRMEAILANPYKERGWSEIFHGRMISFQNIISVQQLQAYNTLFDAYVSMFPDPVRPRLLCGGARVNCSLECLSWHLGLFWVPQSSARHRECPHVWLAVVFPVSCVFWFCFFVLGVGSPVAQFASHLSCSALCSCV